MLKFIFLNFKKNNIKNKKIIFLFHFEEKIKPIKKLITPATTRCQYLKFIASFFFNKI